MKFINLILLLLATIAYARKIDLNNDFEDVTAYGYFQKVGIPLAEKIRQAEEEYLKNPSRIIGGSAANLGQLPYQAGLLSALAAGQGVCGGSLISNQRVLTAAHCWFDGIMQATSITVVLGSVTIFFGGDRQTTTDFIMHENWTPRIVANDVGIIRLPTPVALSSTINVIALPSGSQLNEIFPGDLATASGFGRTAESGSITTAQTLNHANVFTIPNFSCAQTYSIIQDTHICTRVTDGRSTCQGDSGGPLTVIRGGQPIIIGITSFSSGFGCLAAPAGYARVSSYINWITNHL